MNIDYQIKIGYGFVIAGLNTIFWYYLVTIIFASIDRPYERRFLFLTALLWILLKVLQLFYLFSASRFKKHPTKKQFSLTQWLLLLYIFTFIAEIAFSVNRGLGVFDWGANIFEIFLLFNMMVIYNKLRGPDAAKIVLLYEKEIEIKKEKEKAIEQKQQVEGQFIVFDPSLHLETVESPHEQLDTWVSKNTKLNYYGEVNPYDIMYEKDLEGYRNQFKNAQSETLRKAIEGHKGAKGGIIGWIILVSLGNIFPLIRTISIFMDGNAGFWQYFHILLLSVFLIPSFIGLALLIKNGVDQSPKTPGQIKAIPRPIVQFYESESELIVVKVDADNLTENKFNKTDLIGIRSNTGRKDRVRRHSIRGHHYVDVPYNELVLQYFDGDLVEEHQILKMDNETYKIVIPSINKLREAIKADFSRDKSRFRGPSFKVCGACKEIALATDKYCDDCGTMLPVADHI